MLLIDTTFWVVQNDLRFAEFGYTYHGMNIVFLMVSNKRFSSEVKYLIRRMRYGANAEKSFVENTNTTKGFSKDTKRTRVDSKY